MATLANAELFDLGAYPGIAVGEGSVRGEVFDIDDEALVAADVIEGHPDFYERRLEPVTYDDGSTGQAWAYWAPPSSLEGSERIASGDWFDRARRADDLDIDEQLAAAKSDVATNGRYPQGDN